MQNILVDIGIVALLLLNLWVNNGFWEVSNSYEAMVLFGMLTLAPGLALLALSAWKLKDASGNRRVVPTIGFVSAVAILGVVGIHTGFLLIRYYFGLYGLV